MGRPGIKSKDLLWAFKMTQMDQALEELLNGLETLVEKGGKVFTPSLWLKILLARAIVIRPSLLILDGPCIMFPAIFGNLFCVDSASTIAHRR